jgi:O-antigen/teichoic acid export membrane protein
MKNSFFNDLKISFFWKVIGLTISFGIQIFIARVIGLGNFGVWNTALSWMQIILIISLAGNVKLTLRSASVNKEAFNQFIITIVQVAVTYIFLFVVLGGVLKISSFEMSEELFVALIIVFPFGLFKLISMLETSLLQAVQKNYLSIFTSRIVLPVVKAVFIGSLFLVFGNNIQILASYPIAEFIAVIVFLYFIFKNYKNRSWNWVPKIYYNYHFWVNDITKSLLPFINIAIISFLFSEEDIGGYSASYKIGEFLMFFTTIFISFSPVIVRYIKDNRWEDLQAAYLAINKLLLVVVFPFFLFLLVFSGDILTIFGQGFSEYSIVLKILTVGVYMDAVTGPIGEMLNMSKNEAIEKNINVSATILNIILLFVLSSQYGVIGAAISFSLSRFLANSCKLFFANRKLNIKTLSSSHLKIFILQLALIIPFAFLSRITFKIGAFLMAMLVLFMIIKGLKWVTFQEIKTIRNI